MKIDSVSNTVRWLTISLTICSMTVSNQAFGEFVTKLEASDGAADDFFGGYTLWGNQPAVSIHGDVVAVGAGFHDASARNSGAVYVFDRHTGAQTAKIVPTDPKESQGFGITVSAYENLLLIGAPGERDSDPTDDLTGGSGALYQFEQKLDGSWTEISKIDSPDDGEDGNRLNLGLSQSMWLGSTILAGVETADGSKGRVLMYSADDADPKEWELADELTAPDRATNDYYGTKLAISGDTLFVTAPLDKTHGYRAGEAYQYQQTPSGDWEYYGQFAASDTMSRDWFGMDVVADGDIAVISAGRSIEGSAYVFQQSSSQPDQWDEIAKITGSSGADGDQFGESIALDGDLLVIGAPYHDEIDVDAGAVFVFARHAGGLNQWGEVQRLEAPDGGAGDQFGYSVALHENIAVVTAPNHNGNSGAAYVFELTAPLLGDFDRSGVLDAADIDQLSEMIRNGEYDVLFDVNGDKVLNDSDRAIWVKDLRNTYFGDSNLDGEFSSADLVEVFVAAKYESDNPASWAEGDWNGDSKFNSGDFVTAFDAGGYEKGPLMFARVVPEPASFMISFAGLLLVAVGLRRQRQPLRLETI